MIRLSESVHGKEIKVWKLFFYYYRQKDDILAMRFHRKITLIHSRGFHISLIRFMLQQAHKIQAPFID